jgi:fatty-acyl-CoA synthase
MAKRGSIGKPNMYVETKIVNAQEECVQAGQQGELLLKGPNVTPGYYKNSEATAASFAGDWFRTGDIVRTDEDGFLYVVDRIKNMYISGGENVYPAEVEKTISQHPAVQAVAIVGIPDPKWGESGKAFVSLYEGTTLTLEAMRQFCQNKLSRYKIPKNLEILDELPKTDSGKIDRKRLKAWEEVNDSL